MQRTVQAFLAAVLFAVSLGCAASGNESPQMPPLRFYSTVFAQPNPNLRIIEKTRDVIERAIAPRKVEFAMVGIDELEELVRQRKADLVIAGAGLYRRNLRNGLRDIATIVTPLQPNPDFAVGSLIVTREDRTDIRSLTDLKGKVIATNHPRGFQGLYTTLLEITKLQENPDNFFKEIRISGMDQIKTLDYLRNRQADAVILSSCLAENTLRMQGTDILAGLKPVGENVTAPIACKVSTSLYPNWSLMITPALDATSVRKIVVAIHSMPKNEEGLEWGVATDFSAVDRLYKELKRGPYEYLRHWTVKRFLSEYGMWLVAGLILFFGLIGHSVRVSHLVSVRTEQLKDALEKQKELTEKTREITEQYERSRRATTVAQISSMVAHELSQPLTGIIMYAKGVSNLAGRLHDECGCDVSGIQAAIGKIKDRAKKADDIVRRVRQYAKRGREADESADLVQLTEKAVGDFKVSSGRPGLMVRFLPEAIPVPVIVSPLEIELALNNLLKNSSDATEGVENPEIDVRVGRTKEHSAYVKVSDNGPRIGDEQLSRMQEPLASFKENGLGLGLSIVKAIVESHFGGITFERNGDSGLTVLITLPLEETSFGENTDA